MQHRSNTLRIIIHAVILLFAVSMVFLVIKLHLDGKSFQNELKQHEIAEAQYLNAAYEAREEAAQYKRKLIRREKEMEILLTTRGSLRGANYIQMLPSQKIENEIDGFDILSSTPIIVHAMGQFDYQNYLNCLEGFLTAYSMGCRVFEADFRLSQDGSLILSHALNDDNSPRQITATKEAFLTNPIQGRFTPLSFEDILLLMDRYQDICIVTDTAFTDMEMYEELLREMKEYGNISLCNRLIIQVYSEQMFQDLSEAFGFPHYIYTLYETDFDGSMAKFESAAAFCSNHGIIGITMWDYLWNESFSDVAGKYGIKCYVHTVNNRTDAIQLLSTGVNAIYTDELYPDALVSKSPGDSSH